MKITNLILFVSIIFSLGTGQTKTDPVIVTYLQKAPFQIIKPIEKKDIPNKLDNLIQKTPGQISNKLLKKTFKNKIIPDVAGFLAIYAGYIDYSNKDGLISFPLRHTPATKAFLLITEEIKLTKVKGNTFSYATTNTTNTNAELYVCEKKKNKNNILYWEVKKTNLPTTGRINPLTITLLTNPKNVFVEEGDFKSEKSNNLILPNNIYIVGNKNNTKILLRSLNITQYFEPIEFEEKKANEIVNQKIITNK